MNFEDNNINNYDINEIERKIIITKMIKDFNECVENQNFDFYEHEQELLKFIFEHSNIDYKH